MPIHPLWIVAILVIVLIIFGPGRLPELGSAAGKAMREFRKATSELGNDLTSSATATPAAPAPSDASAKSTESASSPKN
jgi:sec-independent protein translocase protein TatA